MEPDFSGWATKAGLECSDGRTIMPEAFKHMDGQKVPLVWAHGHNGPDKVLGHVMLEAKPNGMRCHAFFNDTPSGKSAKALVKHGDVDSLSIWANNLVEKAKRVLHGMIREVSLVLSGANPGAKIDYIRHQNCDHDNCNDPEDFDVSEDEAIIHGIEIEDADSFEVDLVLAHAAGGDQTVREVFDSMTDVQKNAVYFMLAAAAEGTMAQDGTESEEGTEEKPNEGAEGNLDHKEGQDNNMTGSRNVFEQNGKNGVKTDERVFLSHDDMKGIAADAVRRGSLKEAVHAYALAHGIENIDILFPEAKNVTGVPEWDKRRTEWVAGVLNTTNKTPFSRIKTLSADITVEEARAKGYVKGDFKKEEFFAVSKRTTGPSTVYKKQKLDRDDLLDVTDFDMVAWMKGEMRLMLEEELARAILIGDGRAVDDEDKIKDPIGAPEGTGIRSIVNDHELYVATWNVNVDDANSDYYEVIEAVLRGRKLYKGTGTPNFYTTEPVITEMLLSKDALGRRRFRGLDELAQELRVGAVIAVEAMEDAYVSDVLGIMVNLADYNIGADRGGEVSMFDDFDIDYNQFKYLIETRVSGALTKIRSAVVFKKTAGTNVLVNPITPPTFVSSTGVVTIPTQTGVVYKAVNADGTSGATLSAGAQSALAAGDSLRVRAVAASGYYFYNNIDDEWVFTRPAA